MGIFRAILDRLSSEPPKNWAFLRSNEVPKHQGDAKPPIYQAFLTAVYQTVRPAGSGCISIYFRTTVSRPFIQSSPPLPPSGCFVHCSGKGALTAHLIEITYGVTSMVVLVQTGKATSRGGSLTA